MIAWLSGTLHSVKPPLLILNVHGMGYELEVPLGVLETLPVPGMELALFTHLAVREDSHTLYGFNTEQERNLFRTLLKINGVGAKLALVILSGMGVDGFTRAVHAEDAVALARLPGIGKKSAGRLLVELRDRLGAHQCATATTPATAGVLEQATGALINLGYRAGEATQMAGAAFTPESSCEEVIRRALQAALKS